MTARANDYQIPHIGDEQIKLLERLSNACAVSGDEGEVRKIVKGEILPYADEVKVDALGNVLATRRGQGEHRLKVMLAAHMDEVGLMLTHDNGDGHAVLAVKRRVAAPQERAVFYVVVQEEGVVIQFEHRRRTQHILQPPA